MSYYKQEQVKLCPLRPRTFVYHNKTTNLNLPDYGLNKLVDHDIHDIKFQKCIGSKCMAYDQKTHKCKAFVK